MKISLIIQCIDTFGFVPAKDKLRFYADGKRFYPVFKSGGYYIASSELPSEFTLLISSDVYRDLERPVSLGIVRVDLIRKNPPPRKRFIRINAEGYGKAALEYGYFYLVTNVNSGSGRISAENPYRFCLEGRSFLLADTRSGAEEFVVLEKAENAAMTDYSTRTIKNDYNAESSVLLPAFDLYVKTDIPLEKPLDGTAAIRLYKEDEKEFVRIRADSLFS